MRFIPQLIGYPRIGPRRELKWALEHMWSGQTAPEDFETRIGELREEHLNEQREAIGTAADDFFIYDEVLETALMFGIAPDWNEADLDRDPFAVLTALARGTPDREAWEMTKWFDTNYHYVVPEIKQPVDRLVPLPWRHPVPDESVTWVVLGPYSLVKLSKLVPGADHRAVAHSIGHALWSWVRDRVAVDGSFRMQLDEPCLGLVMSVEDGALRDAAYEGARDLGLRQAPLVTVQFGAASQATLEVLGSLGLAVQVSLDGEGARQAIEAWDSQPEHAVTVMDGRSVWPDSFERARNGLASLPDDARPIRIMPSTTLMFLPYSVEGEDLPDGFQFAREKAETLARWASALDADEEVAVVQPQDAEWPAPGELQPRAPRPRRHAEQRDLDLPRFPTTTTGSLPQTPDIRRLRTRLARGEIDRDGYDGAIASLITDAISWQERMGLDVLVHGEFERTDMVEYFAAQMDGFHTTRNGWVLSYGSRCTRPPILAAPPTISAPMTVDTWRLAQAATRKPVKGMLTGPVTIVNWSFRPPQVEDDRLFWAVAQPIGQEVRYLIDAGARVIQIDEPAVRERWPLPTEGAELRRRIYARGVRAALNHVFNQPAHVQMHTHMCYGDFGDIVPLWSDAGVDVASIEFSRSKDDSYIRSFYSLFEDGHLQIGPGVFDVHSPHSPGAELIGRRLRYFEDFMDHADLWVNPDCGLKTRAWDEIERQLGDMVAAARARREADQPIPANASRAE